MHTTAHTHTNALDRQAPPTPAEVLGIYHPSAVGLVDAPTDSRRRMATMAATDRRADLALYVDLYAERYGHRLNLNTVAEADDLLLELTVLAIA